MLPKGVYDALPWLYMAVGAMSAALLEGDLKFLPTVLFFTAGVLVLLYRQASRSAARPHSRTRPAHPRHH
jgi:hypothetical protein